ncbi:hypothetical protein BH10PSE13_BH10PSE13_13810 [soil metagenome]
MARSDQLSGDRPIRVEQKGDAASVLETKAEAMHALSQRRKRHFVSTALHDAGMTLMLTLFIAECRSIDAGEQSVLLANHIAPLEGAALIDTLVQAGLVVVTGTMPGRRSVGLTPLGSARMRAYIADFPV